MSKFNELIQEETPLLVDFYAIWCSPCKVLSPILKEVKTELGNQLKVIKVDIDKNPQVASHYDVSGVPTIILFQKGEQLWRQSGLVPKNQLIDTIKSKITKIK
ncbi:MAG: thioredoxin 1 [Crocinitomicaceae bacterium]|jgi:thioredoxin 1